MDQDQYEIYIGCRYRRSDYLSFSKLFAAVSLFLYKCQLPLTVYNRLAGKYLTTAPRRRRQAVKLLRPVIEERFELLTKEGKKSVNIPVRPFIHII